MDMTGVIYKITNPTGKIYIGCTIDWKRRFSEYRRLSMVGQRKLYNSLKKYGYENHVFEIIEECTKDKLNDKEVYWIEFYNSVNAGLNVSKGGHYFWEVNKGKKHSEATIEKMKEWWAENAKPRSLETIQKITQTKKHGFRQQIQHSGTYKKR